MLRIKNLKKRFNIGTDFEKVIFDGLDLEFKENTATAIIGPNGCGKSTLMNLIAGSLTPDCGIIEIDGEDITKLSERERSKFFGRVYQDPSKSVSPSLSILENMALADNKNKHFGLGKLVDLKKVDYYKSLISQLNLGLENMLSSKVSLLSGGQRQSLSLIMASMKKPKLLLLDEHTASLDPKTSHVVMNKTKALIEDKNISTIMVSHNMKDAYEYSDRVIMLKDGEIVLDELTENLVLKDLEDLYKTTEEIVC